MRKATGIVASAFGIFAGFGGPEHGYFEILRGHVRPDGLFISAMGPPCEPERIWHLCEPAMTLIPSYLVTGIVASVLGIFTMLWASFFVRRRDGGPVLILLSIALLLFGGGLVPPVIGIAAGIMAMHINRPARIRSGGARRLLAGLWPWPLALFFVWVAGQFVAGKISNEFMMRSGLLGPVVLVTLLVLSFLSAHHRDVFREMP